VTPEQFYSNPPWAGGRGGIRMGLHPIRTDDWLTGPITVEERDEKVRLLRDRRGVVLRAEPGSDGGQREFADAVADALHTTLPDAALPLEAASLLVYDDLCLMQRRGDRYVLTAACVCAPSYWELPDKIGKPLDAIHARVPSLNERIGAQMQRFFDALRRFGVSRWNRSRSRSVSQSCRWRRSNGFPLPRRICCSRSTV
jgi:hypothetical protein